MALPNFLQSTLWSYDVSVLDIDRDQKYIITQILNHGTWKQVQWLLKTYPLSDMKKELMNPAKGRWFEDALNYWLTLLNLKLSQSKKDKALFVLDPKVKK